MQKSVSIIDIYTARNLIGKYLIRRVNGKTKAYKIVETEAYVGPHDKASHAHRGRTARNEPMWGPPGHWYIYLTYGMHYMLNLVTGKDGYPAAVLIRGIEEVSSRTKKGTGVRYLVSHKRLDGPGKLTKALKIDKRLNAKKAARANGLWIEDRGEKVPRGKIKRTPRIGIAYAEEWVDKPLRYIIED
jgi:DNA-3-methyladenine glycosylase